MILDIQDPGGLVRALEELAQVDEFVPLVAGKGGSGESLEEVLVFLDLLVEFVGTCLPDLPCILGLKKEVTLIEGLKHFQRDLVSHLAGVFTRRKKT